MHPLYLLPQHHWNLSLQYNPCLWPHHTWMLHMSTGFPYNFTIHNISLSIFYSNSSVAPFLFHCWLDMVLKHMYVVMLHAQTGQSAAVSGQSSIQLPAWLTSRALQRCCTDVWYVTQNMPLFGSWFCIYWPFWRACLWRPALDSGNLVMLTLLDLSAEMLKPRGQTGLEAKILASAS